MKNKKKLAGVTIGIIVILLGIFLITENSKSKADIDIEDEKKIETELIPNIGKAIHKEYQTFGMEYDIISNEKIVLEIKLSEKIADNTESTIVNITEGVISKYNYNPKSFEIIVSSFTN